MTATADNFETIVSFIRSIGIPVRFERIDTECFLPGLSINNGTIVVDTDQLKYPGDILHEAGHIAVVSADERSTLDASTIEARKENAAEEMMTIAWSYAACIHLEIDPGFVFHKYGYKGNGPHIAKEFAAGRYFGVPMLQYTGMAKESSKKNGDDPNVYPKMLKWMR